MITVVRELRCLRNTIHANLFITYFFSGLLWILTLSIQVKCNHIFPYIFNDTRTRALQYNLYYYLAWNASGGILLSVKFICLFTMITFVERKEQSKSHDKTKPNPRQTDLGNFFNVIEFIYYQTKYGAPKQRYTVFSLHLYSIHLFCRFSFRRRVQSILQFNGNWKWKRKVI